MENDQTQPVKNSSNKSLPVVVVVVILLLLVGGFFYYKSKKASESVMGTTTHTMVMQNHPSQGMHNGMMMGTESGHMHPSMNMQPLPTPTLTQLQISQIASGTATTTTNKSFTIDGGNFYFTPNAITVNKGDKVTITFVNDGGYHDFVIDALNVKTPIITTGKTATVMFTATTAGTYQFYCSVPHHKTLGMVGTLTVK